LVLATHSLGREIRVTRLDLIAEFLGILAERDQLLERIRIQHGTDELYSRSESVREIEDLAQRLERDDNLVRQLGNRLQKEGAFRLRGVLLDYRESTHLEPGERDDADTLADHILHETVEAERDSLLFQRFQGREGFNSELEQLVQGGSRGLQEAMFNGLSGGEQRTLHRWLKAFRRSTLNYTWLSPSGASETPINHLLTLMMNHESNPYGWLRQLSNDAEYADLGGDVYGLWEELARLFSQIDFDDIVEDLKGGIPPFGPGVDDRINIVPGDEKVACKPVLLAFARGSGGGSGKTTKFAFENVMKNVKQHLIDCQDVLRLVVVVTDTWDSRKFMEDHYAELSSWRQRKIRFLFLGVGAPRNELAPIAVRLA
jgi:hypothetical protein